MSLKENIDYELSGWKGKSGICCGPRYILDTVLYHEKNTDALYKAKRGLELSKDKSILEIGSNAGGFCFLFAKTAKEVWGIDLLIEPLEYAEKFKKWINERSFEKELWKEEWCHPPDWDVSNVHFKQGNAYDLPLENEIFDVVFMYSCIEHFPKQKRGKSVKEAKRVLKDNGLLVISTITDVDGPNRIERLREISEDVHPFGLCSLEDIIKYINKSSLEIIEAEETWFGEENKIKLAFVVAKKTVAT